MANPTTNYGWPMPTSTDLVTDLPADFALFGQPVDTSLKALNPETTLGDIAYRSSTSNTNTRLGIGTSGQVLAVSGGGVPAWATVSSGAVTLISTVTLTTTASTISFTSIPATYTHLRLTWQGDMAGVYGNLFLRFNADTAGNYDYQVSSGSAATASAGQTFAAVYIAIGLIGSVTGGGSIMIPNYKATTLNKVAISQGFTKYGTASGNMFITNNGGTWRNSSAITQLDFTSDSGDFQNGTVFTLYGES